MFQMDKKKFGAFVSQLRKEKGYTQKELAQRLFISDKAVSKWETGASIPDTPLLVPLSELLGVTVTELLLSKRIEQKEKMGADEVENLVKTALCCGEESSVRAYHNKSIWFLAYGAALLLGVLLTFFYIRLHGVLTEPFWTSVGLAAGFGIYFCFFVPLKLPAYYDENKISAVYDGPFRMNLLGLRMSNRNWPHIVNVARSWACLSLVIFPGLSLIIGPKLWNGMGNFVMLMLLLGGLFIPMYLMGKKYE